MAFQNTRKLPIVSLLVVGFVLSSNAWALSKEVSKTLPFSADGRVSLENINGSVTIEGWDQDEISLHALVEARSQKGLDRTEVLIDATETRLHVETEYKKSGWGDHDGGEVTYTLKVPRQVRLDEIELVNGSLELRGVSGPVRASLVNGRARAENLAGDVEISTVNGGMDISFDELGRSQRVSLESVNGSLEMKLPNYADAEIDASTVHGRIQNDLGLDVEKGRWVGSNLRGTLGNGSAQVSLENVNGSIDILGK